MRPSLEPRTVFYRFPEGQTGSITLRFIFDDDEVVDLGEGPPMRWLHAHASIQSDWYTSSVRAIGADELQVLCRLMKVTGSALMGACNRAGATLYTIVPDQPVEDVYDVFF